MTLLFCITSAHAGDDESDSEWVKLCNTGKRTLYYAVYALHKEYGFSCTRIKKEGCYVDGSGWYLLKGGRCARVDMQDGYDAYVSVSVGHPEDSGGSYESFVSYELNPRFERDSGLGYSASSGVTNIWLCGNFKRFERRLEGNFEAARRERCSAGWIPIPASLLIYMNESRFTVNVN
ncbi:hypothetical protein [uncultured Methylibium sp.]|uniref:hypothetical protein n=1 Tax=uncultured Methylibium sp. TaxID=381093 RepID=UPI0025F9C544|nr:hypothetical protein [uncultured Methylibium sp.]